MSDEIQNAQANAKPQGEAETHSKFANQKAVLAYLNEKFPRCFTLEGEARPLKIGIFQDLAAALEGDETVSKTQIRHALRHYTSSWRYLYGCKVGAVRVDLDGNDAGELEQEHIDHAQAELKQAKARLAERRAKQNANKKDERKGKSAVKPVKKARPQVMRKPAKTQVNLSAVDANALQKGDAVKVKVAEKINAAVVLDVMKDSAKVQLNGGITLNVPFAHLYRA
ncbi:RNA chaperone ProQ [Spirabiliibacterium falconis]|uniref:RNA chaperone ProQ n=1 Tax=Spirabiliibacterium falconis TaxID=572023 RepID=UPI001AAC8D6C|nr:RNA chaperone ProQ [Spirabiliibacterium falconis]MBE2893910.1 RNA chaperone ProQ [Spirabiliibacterium falconis]